MVAAAALRVREGQGPAWPLPCALSVPVSPCPGPREAAAVVAAKSAAVSRPRRLGCGAGDFANASRDVL